MPEKAVAKKKFEPYGPFTLPRQNGGVDRARCKAFWEAIGKEHSSLPEAIGCYIFAIKAGNGYTPWYVGKTDKQSFRRETWADGKLLIFGEVIRNYDKGKPVLFLLAKLTNTGKFVKPTTRKRIESVAALEEMLIGTCLQRNRELYNKKTTKYLKELHVPGYINDQKGARPKNAKALAELLKT